jgi:hypothetical protein
LPESRVEGNGMKRSIRRAVAVAATAPVLQVAGITWLAPHLAVTDWKREASRIVRRW